jgi:hypothetical protein
MARVLSAALVLALLAATAAAFAVTEGAKLELSPIAGTQVSPPLFSPRGQVKTVVHVRFRLRKSERLEVWIENGDGRRVRTLLAGRAYRRGARLDLVWDGLSDDAIAEPDGVYTPVVKLERSHRTIALPSPIRIDTKRPVITLARHALYPIFSPDGDGHRDGLRFVYTVSKPAHAILVVQPAGGSTHRVEFTLGQRLRGVLVWNGKLNGRAVRPGRYVLSAGARDRAGNTSKLSPFAIAQVRYIALARSRVVARPGGRFAIRVSTDAPTVEWRLHGRSGTTRRGTMHFRAPRTRGVYHLYVYAGGHAARCAVVVA